jgi:hypothetical protein
LSGRESTTQGAMHFLVQRKCRGDTPASLLLEGGKMEPIEKTGKFIGPGGLCVIRKSGSRPAGFNKPTPPVPWLNNLPVNFEYAG